MRLLPSGEVVEVRKRTKKACQTEVAGLVKNGGEQLGDEPEKVGRDHWIGKIYVSVREPDGTIRAMRRKVTDATKSEVEKRVKELARASESGEVRPAKSATVGALVVDWRRSLSGQDLSPASMQQLSWTLDKIDRHLGAVRLNDPGTAHCHRALVAATEGQSKRSAQIIVRTLERMLDYGRRTGQLVTNPAVDLKASDYGTVRPERVKGWTEEQAAKLWNEAGRTTDDGTRKYWIGNLVRLGLVIGARSGELAALCWDAVDLEAGTVTIRRSRRDDRIVDELKTDKSRRVVPIVRTASQC